MVRTLASVCIALGAALAVAEVTLQALPVSSATMMGYHHDPDLLTYPPHHRWQVSTGWDLRNPHTLRSNNWGFVADHDFAPGSQAVALIGDSYVESSMLDRDERPAAQLEALLKTRPVYAMGTPGTALLDDAQRIRWAASHLGIRDFVVLLERFDARQSLCGSGNVVSRCLDPQTLTPRIERRAEPSTLKQWLRHSALAQYVSGQLRVQPQAILQSMFTRRAPEEATSANAAATSQLPSMAERTRNQQMVDAVVAQFFATAAPHLQGQLVFVVDGRRTGPAAQPDLSDHERSHLMAQLRARGATVYDMEPIYAAHAKASPRLLDVGPYDRHLNRIGVRLAMAQAAAALQPRP
jgi:hypothetical protein